MTKFYALNPGGDIVYLGEYADFGEAADAHMDMIWVVDESSARDWWISLSVFKKDHWDKN